MRTVLAACLVAAMLLVAGCQTPAATTREDVAAQASDDTSAAEREQLEAAALFAIARHVGDSGQLSAMIAPEDAARLEAELATIPGTAVDLDQVRFEYPEYLEGSSVVGVYGNLEVLCGAVGPSVFLTHCLGEPDTDHYHMITLVAADSGWIVDTIDDRDAATSLLRLTPDGQTCLDSLSSLTNSAKSFRARSADYTVPASPSALVPDFIAAVPVCPAAGEYTFDDSAVAACSVHGEHMD